MTSRTRWVIEHDSLMHSVKISLETSDPEIVRLVEESAATHGLPLLKILQVSTATVGADRDRGYPRVSEEPLERDAASGEAAGDPGRARRGEGPL
jgi:hypothetical protein